MNSAVIGIIGVVWFLVAYRIYGRIIEKRLVVPNDDRKTPAHAMGDGVDFHPAKPLVLFGHHFSSIAGAGPIIGPVIAAHAFGFAPSFIWILIGAVLVGAVHDYTTLMVSVRNNGRSIPDIAREFLGGKARVLFQIFVLIALVFINAVFAIAAGKSFIAKGEIVIPAFGIIPVAMLFGWMMNRLRIPLVMGTIGSLLLLVGLFVIGYAVPVVLPFENPDTVLQVWIAILMLYGAVAAILPVWLLLQPRDYIASWILAVGMIAGFGGLLITHHPISAPMMTGWVSKTQGPIWPMLVILIACGAVSGFHSLVSSGTSAKQLAKESDGKVIGYGSMITEGALALLALLAVTAGLSFAGNNINTPSLTSFLSPGGGGPISAFATGFGTFTEPFMGPMGILFGMMMLNAFVLTTLDTSVRLSRFITVELLGPLAAPLGNRYVATLLPVILSYLLAATGSQGSLWPMFGAANQLIAALSLIVVTAYFMKRKKSLKYTLIPALFMLVTACGALLWKGYAYLTAETPNYVLAFSALVLLALAIFVVFQGVRTIRQGLQGNTQLSNDMSSAEKQSV
jgi:carbon starvation protein